jgi:hypothetical protein
VEPGANPGRLGVSLRQRSLEVALCEIPLPQTLVDAAKLALDAGEATPVTERGRCLVAREGRWVFAEQGMQVADSLMECGGFRVPQRERRTEVTERLAISVQRPGVLARQLEVLCRLRVPASRPVVVRDLAR